MEATFWGTRGSFPAIGRQFARYGGDTACVSAACGAHVFVFDAGTGLARLGKTIAGAADIDLFLSHGHIDHIIGLAYFDPIWRKGTNIRIWCEQSMAADLRAALHVQFAPPFHPVALADVPATIEWAPYRAGVPFSPRPGVDMVGQILTHPGGAAGMRLEHAGASLVYGADTGALEGAQRQSAQAWAAGADLLILDATFTCSESTAHPDWGHMSWREAVVFGAEADARQIALFHHGPDRTDDELDAILRDAREIDARALVASDGMTIRLDARAMARGAR